MKKRVLSLLLALALVLSMVPANLFAVVTAVAGNEIPVADNVIDITDKQIYKLTSSYQVTATKITVSGADVVSATEEGTTVHVLLDGTTAPDAEVSVEFGYSGNKCALTDHTGTVTLENGTGTLAMKVKGYYTSMSSRNSTVDYTINFTVDAPPTEVPSRLRDTDTLSTYNGVALELDLSQYFEKAQTYYLVEGENKIALEGKTYTFLSQEGGAHTLVFAAANTVGQCPDRVTVTVNVTAIESGIWIGKESSNGGLNYVLFSDAQGNKIDGLQVALDGTAIRVSLPKDYPVNGTVKATFNLTQNGGLPFITTKTGTSGTSSGKAENNKFTEKSTTLSGGAATFTFYYYNTTPTTTSNNYQTWSVVYAMVNDLPVLADGVGGTAAATITAGENYGLDLAPIFADADGDALTYKVSIDGSAAVAADVNYTYTTDVAGTYTLVFTANDGKGTSTDTYTVTLTVENVKQTDSMTVSVPEGLQPSFWVSPGFEGGVDQQGDAVQALKGATADGMTAYTVNYPANATMLSVRAEGWGGMAFPVQKDGAVSLRKVQFAVVDYENNPAPSTNTVTYDGYTAVAGSEGWLLVTGKEYSYKAVPTENTETLAQVTETAVLEAGAGICTRQMMLNIQNPMAITVPTGAKAQLYKYNQYYSNTELDPKIITDNGDGTTTFNFVADTKNGTFIYKVTKEGKITKAGWVAWGKQDLTVTYTEADKDDTYRLDDYSGTGAANSGVAEDSVLLNINSRNHLNLSVGQSKVLKAYRAWEIIPVSYNNYIVTPDFTYTVLSGSDVVSLTQKQSASTADGDWMTLTALKEGVAVIQVTYGAVEVSGGQYDGIYGATDPARAGLLVVQVGADDDSSVDFGIDCFSSIGKSGSNNISYNPNNKKAWDAEFDTLYFTGSSGELKLSPTASSHITEVAVSNDKGASWTVLTGTNGVYTAKIVSGNNIIRVKTASGTAYQVVRGDKITVKLTEVSGKSDGDGIVEAGETIRVSLVGLHNPIPKMAGNYNPGYAGNYDGYNSQHLNYTANGTAVYGPGAQYNFITAANYIDILMPEDGGSVTLDNGYIGLGVIGLTAFTDGGDSHRNIPDGGCTTRGSATSYHTRSMLPQITVSVGNTSSPNAAPIVRANAVTEGSIYADQKFAVNPDTLFQDPDGNALTFTVSVDGGAAETVGVDYKFVPGKVGTFKLTFTASDGKLTATHTVTVTVTERPKEEEKDDTFGLQESEIAGYVTVSIVDNGVRVAGETGLKYPVPLGTIVPSTKVPFKQGENMAQVTKRLLDHLGMGMGYSGSLTGGFYLGSISNFEVDGTPYGTMGEFDAGVGSGWMVTLNGWFINMGASEFAVKAGDAIVWKYTCQLGADIGDTYYSSVKDVIKLIDNIGTVSTDSKDKIDAAREAYNKLPADQRSRVTNYSKLAQAEKALAKLQQEADEAAAKKVEALFDKLNSKSAAFEADVKAAQKAYNGLTEQQKKLVKNYQKLADSLKELASEADKEKAREVEKLIAAIGSVTKDSQPKLQAAREAYGKLTDAQRAMVGNLDKLEEAEAALKRLYAVDNAKDIYTSTGDFIQNLGTPAPGSVGGEWMAIGLLRSGIQVDGAYYEAVVKYVQENADEKGRLHSAKSTENSRIILALTAMGKDVTDVGGVNLLAGLNEMDYLNKQGNNGPIWALIAFDSGNYPTPAGDVTREALLRAILDAQLSDGGWVLSGDVSDVDMTGMALQALAPYYGTDAQVREAVDRALAMLSEIQNEDGSFTSIDGANSESVVQVVVALSALGIDAHTDERFIKNGNSALDALCAYYVQGGGFRHVPEGSIDGMATEQGYYALTAYFRMLEGKTALYDMTDVVDRNGREKVSVQTAPAQEKENYFLWVPLILLPVAALTAGAVLIRKKRKH